MLPRFFFQAGILTKMASSFSYASWLLSKRAYTEYGLKEKLVNKKFDIQEIETTLSKLKELGLINDTHFASEYIRSKSKYSHRGRYRIKAELMKKGVAKESIDAQLGQLTREDEVVSAKELIKLKQKSLERYPQEVQFQRRYALLARRGYSLDVIKEALRAE